ncbi:MAG: hypothetical protein HQL49_07505 [Gammaproteobacteria bacterium]|nr:hypothetical protein [Gammaproteobacteria bacterium]
MGLLDELKSAAAQQEQQRMADRQRLAAIEARYQTQLKPIMQRIYRYFSDLQQQMVAAHLEITTDYLLPGLGKLTGLSQSLFKINVDSSENLRELTLQFSAGYGDSRLFTLHSATAAEEARSFFDKYRIRYVDWALRDEKNPDQIIGAKIEAHILLPMVFQFNADVENGLIRLSLLNFNHLGVRRLSYTPEKINDNWLDELGYFLLRKRATLHSREISEESREVLRESVRREQEQREREVQEAIAREEANRANSKPNSFFSKLLK